MSREDGTRLRVCEACGSVEAVKMAAKEGAPQFSLVPASGTYLLSGQHRGTWGLADRTDPNRVPQKPPLYFSINPEKAAGSRLDSMIPKCNSGIYLSLLLCTSLDAAEFVFFLLLLLRFLILNLLTRLCSSSYLNAPRGLFSSSND